MSTIARRVGGGLLKTLVAALFILNTSSGVVAGIWLAIVGEWSLIVLGLAMSFLLPWAWIIAALPSMGLAFLLSLSLERENRASMVVIAFLSSIYNDALIVGWTSFVLIFFIGYTQQGPSIPVLLWGYATATAPLCYMASKEPPGSFASTLGCLLAQVGYILMTALTLIGVGTRLSIGVFAALALLVAIAMTILAYAIMPPSRSSVETETEQFSEFE